MTDTQSTDAAGTAGTAAAAAPRQLQGDIVLSAGWGSFSMLNVGPGTAVVEWTQGNPPLQSAALNRSQMPLIPMPRPYPPTALQPGPNPVPIDGYWYRAGIDWAYSGEAGAAKFSMNLPGIPTGPDGWAEAARIESPWQGTFQILATPEPASWTVYFNIQVYDTTASPSVMMYVDGAFLATCVDRMEVVANGKVVSLAVDARGFAPTGQIELGFIINPGRTASVSRRKARTEPPSSA